MDSFFERMLKECELTGGVYFSLDTRSVDFQEAGADTKAIKDAVMEVARNAGKPCVYRNSRLDGPSVEVVSADYIKAIRGVLSPKAECAEGSVIVDCANGTDYEILFLPDPLYP